MGVPLEYATSPSRLAAMILSGVRIRIPIVSDHPPLGASMRGPGIGELTCALLAVVLLYPGAAVAQERQPHPVGFWGSLALGPAGPYGFGGTAGAAVRYRRVVVRFRTATSRKLFGDGVGDWGVLAGGAIAHNPARSMVTLAAGLGRATSSRGCLLCGRTSLPARTALLLDAEARLAVMSFFGITFNAFADINGQESFGGVGVGIYLGRL